MIRQGDNIPSVTLKQVSAAGTEDVDVAELVSGGRTVMFTVPGAFTPTCSNNHLPGFIAAAPQFARLGVARILCATVNDHHVVKAWAEAQHSGDAVSFLADFDASLAQALGLSQDRTKVGLGVRFVRAALVINDGVVEHVFIDDAPGEVGSSGALAVLDVLKQQQLEQAG